MFWPYVPQNAIDEVVKVLQSRWIGQGPRVDAVEKKFCEKFNIPYSVTVNSGTSALHLALILAGVRDGDEVITTPMTCVSSKTPILLSNGKTEQIGKIVRAKKKLKIISYNTKLKKFEEKEIINWYRTPLGHRAWYRLHYQNAPNSRGENNKKGVWLTNDHPVLTKRGYVKVDNLNKKDDLVATNQIMLNKKQTELVTGSLLGDSFLQRSSRITGSRYRYYLAHENSQIEWLKLKIKSLRGFKFYLEPRGAYKQSKAATAARTSYCYQYELLAKKYYNKGKKVVPKDIKLTPLSLVTWYLDDGTLNGNGAMFCCESFSLKEMKFLCRELKRLGIEAVINKYHQGSIYRIYVGNSRDHSADKLFKMIAEYVPPSMKYKIPKKFRDIKFDKKLWNLGRAEILYDKPVINKGNPHPEEHQNFSYCIDVKDNHNFISGDLILHNCTATNIPILYCGGRAVFADIKKHSMNIDPKSIAEKITPKTKAIMVVHWAGYPCDMAEIHDIAKAHNLSVIEDAAHALGAKYKNQYIGALSDFTCFSFQAIKQITTVDGGMLTVQKENDYKRAKILRWYGIDREFKGDIYWKYQITEPGYKYHMNDMTAAMLDVQLDLLEPALARRREIVLRYLAELKNISGLTLLERKPDRESGNWLFTIQVEKRDDFQKKLAEAEIESHMVHVRNDICPIFGGVRQNLPVMNEVENKYISIPLHNHLTDDDVEKVIRVIKEGW